MSTSTILAPILENYLQEIYTTLTELNP